MDRFTRHFKQRLFFGKLRRLSRQDKDRNEIEGDTSSQLPNIFKKLPVELLHEIALLMPLSSAAEFTLSCRFIASTFGMRYVDRLWTDRNGQDPNLDDRILFLRKFEESLPNQFLCRYCGTYHKRARIWEYSVTYSSRILEPAFFQDPKRTIRCYQRHNSIQVHQNVDVNWNVINLITRAHRLGPNFGWSQRSMFMFLSPTSNQWGLWSEACRDGNRLLFRSRAMYVVNPSNLPSLERRAQSIVAQLDYRPCAHNDARLVDECRAAVARLRAEAPAARAGFDYKGARFRCPHCPVEYMVCIIAVDARSMGKVARYLFPTALHYLPSHFVSVVRWIDFGEGGLLPSPEWEALCRAANDPTDLRPYPSPLEDISARFDKALVKQSAPSVPLRYRIKR